MSLIKNSEDFMKSMLETMKNKNHDYTWWKNEYTNFTLIENLWITSTEKWILVRMCDKIARLTSVIDKEIKVKDETVIDTLLDLANYSIILASYIKDNK